MGADGGGPIGAAGGVLVEGTGPPNVGAGAMDLGVIDGRDLVAVPDPTRGGGDQASQGLSDALLVPGAVLGEGFQGLPGGGLLQGQDRLGDGVFLDVDRHGGDPLGEMVEAAAGEGPSEGVEQGLPDGPGELSFGHDASPVSGPVGFRPPGRFRPGDAAFQCGTPAQLLWSFSWKLLIVTGSAITLDVSRLQIDCDSIRAHITARELASPPLEVVYIRACTNPGHPRSASNMTTWVNSQFPRPDFHRQVQRHYGLRLSLPREPLEEVPAMAVATSPPIGVRREEQLHALGEVGARRLEDQVEVIGQEDKGIQRPSRPPNGALRQATSRPRSASSWTMSCLPLPRGMT